MNFAKMYSEEETGFCKYLIFVTAANCGDACDSRERTFVYYTFIDNTPEWEWLEAVARTCWAIFVYWAFYPWALGYNIFLGDFDFFDR